MLGEWAVEAQEPGAFFETAAEQRGWLRGLSPRGVKPIHQVKPALQAAVQRGVGLSMAEAKPETGL